MVDQPRVTLDPARPGTVGDKLHEPLEDQLSSALAAATEQIDGEYAGQGVDEVYQMLLDRTRDGLHPDIAAAFNPDRRQLRDIATAITRRD
jgi:hypothetical protein